MSLRRTKCLSTKLTDEEYARLERLAGDQTLGTWARAVLLHAATPESGESVILAELLALRTILLNLHFALATGDQITADRMQQLIQRADQDKFLKAHDRLAGDRELS